MGERQEIRFVRGRDGVRIAYAVHGSGPPLIVVSCWLSHLQYDWESPVWHHFLEELGGFTRLVRYDERGFGMSDRNVADFSHEARLGDLEAVIDALGFERFSLLGMSDGSSVAMLYAARHPERVARLILYGTVCGERVVFEGERLLEEQMRWFDELQRRATSTENYLAARAARYEDDVTAEIANVKAPTLILHALGDNNKTFENATQVGALIADSRLVPLDSRNHILLAGEPAWLEFVAEVRAFLEPERAAWSAAQSASRSNLGPGGERRSETLSQRELEILRLAAEGRPNAAIATELGLSPRTIERHLSNAYGKLGVTGSAARAAAVAEILRAGLA